MRSVNYGVRGNISWVRVIDQIKGKFRNGRPMIFFPIIKSPYGVRYYQANSGQYCKNLGSYRNSHEYRRPRNYDL